MEQGYIVDWNDAKGYGFISREGKRDVFMHVTAARGKWVPRIGDHVEYDIASDDKGRLHAVNVYLIPYGETEP